jgi:A/G-specific adenine glycosylase
MNRGLLHLPALPRLRHKLLAWFDQNRRDLPWRRTLDPYAIWVSEIMLQQTRVAVVVERYTAFLECFPTVTALAHAAESSVLALWSGLGYYRRARMLYQAAGIISAEFAGKMPTTAADLRKLPGVGAYTSAAIASIAHGEPVAVVDGNVERVVQRLVGIGSDSTSGRAELVRQTNNFAQKLLDPDRPGDHNQAMMELGATICLPRNPLCLQCPLERSCKTRGEHPTPRRAQMTTQEAGYAVVLRSGPAETEVLLAQRAPAETVMPSMWELPSLLDSDIPQADQLMAVRHAIMQVNYAVRIRSVAESDVALLTASSEHLRWTPLSELPSVALTGLARKVLQRAKLVNFAPARRIQ